MRSVVLAAAAVGGLVSASVWAFPASGAHGRAPVCDPHATVQLDVAAAARSRAIGSAAVRGVARQLTSATPICNTPARGHVKSELARISRAQGASQVHRELLAVLAWIRAHPTPPHARSTAAAQTPCDLDRTIHIHLTDAHQVADDIAVDIKAQQLGDDAGSAAAEASMRSDYGKWAGAAIGQATSIPDFVTIAAGAQMLGLGGISEVALDHARRAAAAHYEAIRTQMDACFPGKRDLDCQTRAGAIVMLLEASDLVGGESALSASLGELSDAVAHDRPVDPCQEWALTMTMKTPPSPAGPVSPPPDNCSLLDTDSQGNLVCDDYLYEESGTETDWQEGRFRVDPTTGRFVKLPGKTWSGVLESGGETIQCLVDNPNGGSPPWVSVGTRKLTGGPLHYSIDGSVSSGEIDLSVSNTDVNLTVTGPDGCNGGSSNAEIEQSAGDSLDAITANIPFTVAAGQTLATYHQGHLDGFGTALDATIRLVS